MGKRFEIIDTTPPYEPAERPEPRFRLVQHLASSYSQHYAQSHKLYITLEAMGQIASHIDWGQYTKNNRTEQGGLLIGEVFKDSPGHIVYAVVHAAVAGMSARGSVSYLEMFHNTWKEMLDAVEEIRCREPNKGLQVIGWYHTHPNNLGVFMSGTDRETQARLFARDWQFAVVLNPHSKEWRAFYGRDAVECCGFVVEDIEEQQPPEFDIFLDEASRQFREGLLYGVDDGTGIANDGELLTSAENNRGQDIKLLWIMLALLLLIIILEAMSIGLQALAISRQW